MMERLLAFKAQHLGEAAKRMLFVGVGGIFHFMWDVIVVGRDSELKGVEHALDQAAEIVVEVVLLVEGGQATLFAQGIKLYDELDAASCYKYIKCQKQ